MRQCSRCMRLEPSARGRRWLAACCMAGKDADCTSAPLLRPNPYGFGLGLYRVLHALTCSAHSYLYGACMRRLEDLRLRRRCLHGSQPAHGCALYSARAPSAECIIMPSALSLTCMTVRSLAWRLFCFCLLRHTIVCHLVCCLVCLLACLLVCHLVCLQCVCMMVQASSSRRGAYGPAA